MEVFKDELVHSNKYWDGNPNVDNTGQQNERNFLGRTSKSVFEVADHESEINFFKLALFFEI